MNASSRIIINTFAQYIRTVINILLSLYSARLVLEILGVEDYGLYALVAGVVSMLSFFTNSLVSSTQRFLSISQGRGDLERLRKVFGNSLLLHIFLGLLVAILLEALTPFLFHGFLNIPVGREDAAIIIYQQVILMVYISFIAAPYRALLVSRENIVYISIIDVLDGVLKVVFVLLLPFIPLDKLIAYGWVMLLSVLDIFTCALYGVHPTSVSLFPFVLCKRAKRLYRVGCILDIMYRLAHARIGGGLEPGAGNRHQCRLWHWLANIGYGQLYQRLVQQRHRSPIDGGGGRR